MKNAVEKSERLRWLNQYGYEMDAFDKYRTAMHSSNRGALRVLGFGAVALSVCLLAYNLAVRAGASGFFFCGVLLAAGVLTLWQCHRREGSRLQLLLTGYFLYIAFYMLGIYGSVNHNNGAFWVGVQMGLCGFMLDYAWRVFGLQLVSYFSLILAWDVTGKGLDGQRILFATLFLLCGMVATWAQGRSRIAMITSREQTRQRAETDLLTGLTIRAAAQQEIERHLKESKESGVLMLLDLDRFKSVNDQLGHQMGDRVLIEVASDLKKMFRSSDILSRLGGDEFIVYMKGVPERSWAEQRAEQVVRTVRRWVGEGETHVQISASVGVVTTEMVERSYSELYRAADIAMYFSKADGGNSAVFYSKNLLEQALGRATTRQNENREDSLR